MHSSPSRASPSVLRAAIRAAFLVSILAACGDEAAQRQVALAECRLPRLATTAQCGTVEVPEDRAVAGGRKIAIAFALLPANTRRPRADPLFMLAGGPGQSAAALAPLAGVLGGVRRDRDIVLVDPRGTGKSAPLQCAALAPRDPFDEFTNLDTASAAQRCLAEIKAAGSADVALYTTPAYVADLDAVRAALGYERINLWGGSYGTRAAQEYLRRYPQHVRSVVLDGVAPPELRISLDIWPTREAELAQLFAACAETSACKHAYPDLNATLAALQKDLGTGRVLHITDPRTGAARQVTLTFDLVIGALHALIYAPEFASLIPAVLARAQAGDFAPLAAAALTLTDDVNRSMNLALHYAVTCAEDTARVTAADAKQAFATLRAPALAEQNLAACDGWPRPALPADFNAPLVSDKPVLILSGGLDPVTPPANGKKVAETLPNSRHVIASGYGHIVSAHACAPRLIEKFIDEAGFGTLPQSCLDHLATSTRPAIFTSLLQTR